MAARHALVAWEVSADREEPWRRFLQELAGPRQEEHAASKKRLGVSAELVWFAPKHFGGGITVVYLEAEDPDWTLGRALRELAVSDEPFDAWYQTQMRGLFDCDLAGVPRVAGGELLFAWREGPSFAQDASLSIPWDP